MSEWNPIWKPATEEQVAAQADAAELAAEQHDQAGLVAISARYEPNSARIIIELKNGTAFMFPPSIAQGLAGATAGDLSVIELSPAGWSLNWPRLNAGFTVEGLLAGIFGGERWMSHVRSEYARKGGQSTSEEKRAAARANGKKGGRPRKAAM